jgi:ABC-type antimicrobial peptide transport system permease subunit
MDIVLIRGGEFSTGDMGIIAPAVTRGPGLPSCTVVSGIVYTVDGQSPLGPTALAAACVLMTLAGILAAWIPASLAAEVDPMTVLRDES